MVFGLDLCRVIVKICTGVRYWPVSLLVTRGPLPVLLIFVNKDSALLIIV